MDDHKIRNMEEFARVSGISRPTLSKYFQDSESVRPTTRARIEAALDRFDYTPNIYAMNQNRRLTKNVGIVVPYLADPFFAEIARRIERRCIEAGFSPTLFSAHGDPRIEGEILDTLRSIRPAGILMAPLGRLSDRAMIERFCRDVPTVLFDSNLRTLGEAFIGSDNASFVEQAIDYLCRDGGRPWFFGMRTPANPNANKRRDAYVAAMRRRGLEPEVVEIEGEGWEFERIGYEGATALLADGGLPGDAVLCSNDRLAIGLLSAAFNHGVAVGRTKPGALRVASMDDHPVARFTCPALTTAAHDYDAVAGESVATLIRVIESGGRLPRRTERLIPARLVIRASA
ncbi:LacI family DNA-binding transcriptional regulator [Jannaschia sp. LMIT008]|uniref:LacI family DNA-binding transcriptional regulator n=1 Tax=Jannaschia maritima TaxID=3032585 RepID=UPI0028115529|nr:LacI family DNA-binding transcriptional regulator [Jannaschia sp. LMIT008]